MNLTAGEDEECFLTFLEPGNRCERLVDSWQWHNHPTGNDFWCYFDSSDNIELLHVSNIGRRLRLKLMKMKGLVQRLQLSPLWLSKWLLRKFQIKFIRILRNYEQKWWNSLFIVPRDSEMGCCKKIIATALYTVWKTSKTHPDDQNKQFSMYLETCTHFMCS